MSQLARTNGDADLRAEIFRYSMEHASPAIRPHIQRLCGRWIEYNETYFQGGLEKPFIAFGSPHHTNCYGSYSNVSSFGGSGQITIRPSIVKGTLQHFRNGNKDKEGLGRFMDQVLLHEMIHQWQVEINGTPQTEFEHYAGHGPTFSAKANEIGATLDLPPVRRCGKKDRSGDTAHLPTPTRWPHEVTPLEYYLGAYVPVSKDYDVELKKALAVQLKRHGLAKVIRFAEEVWERIEADRQEVTKGKGVPPSRDMT